jgi:hypothetical protein
MAKMQLLHLAAIFLLTTGPIEDVAGQNGEKAAVESTVRNYEQACERFDFAKANSLLAPTARWIEDSYPQPAEFNGQGWSKRWEEYKSANLHINYQPRDIDTQVLGDAAWVTLTLESTFTADNSAALALNDSQREWRGIFVESLVLVKTDAGWRIALGHTSLLPKKKP